MVEGPAEMGALALEVIGGCAKDSFTMLASSSLEEVAGSGRVVCKWWSSNWRRKKEV